MATITITPSKAKELMEESKGSFFTVFFIKKDGTYREMNARLGVSIDVNGKGRSFDPKDYELIGVFDMQKHAHRMVNLRTVLGLNIGGKQYKVRV